MAIIYSYPLIGELATSDTIAISDTSNGNKTKSVTIGQLDSYINTGQATIIQVDDRVVTGASFNTNDGLLTLTRNGGEIPSVTTNLDGRYALTTSLAAVATSGSYNDLLNQPTIPPAYTNADVDTHLKTSTAEDNQVLSWTGTEYDWVAQSGGGGAVDSVNGETGVVVLDTDDIDEGTTNLYFPGFGTTVGTALEGNTPVIEGTASTDPSTTAITEIRTLTSAEYLAITPASDVMYVIV
jgi:hypothetical protein